MITVGTFKSRVETELAARGLGTETSEPYSIFVDSIANALFASSTGLWRISVTTPGTGPIVGPATHTHLIAPGVITNAAIAVGITSYCVSRGYVPGFGWEILRDAFSSGIATILLSAATTPMDGNVPHTHQWLSVSGPALRSLVMAPLVSNPSLDLLNPASRLELFVDAVSNAFADEIAANGEAYSYVIAGTVHTHLMR